ncbi:MAG: anthranilate synthase component I family protein [Planctomycetota bacterium]
MPKLRFDSSLADDAGWSLPLCEPRRVLVGEPDGRAILDGTRIGNVRDGLRWLDRERREHAGWRWAGYLSYDLGRLFEPAAQFRPRATALPLYALAEVPVSSRASRAAHVATPSDSGAAKATPASNFTRDGYLAAVQRCLDYIAAGDIFQVNLSQRLRVPFVSTAAALYDALLARSPADYGALLDFTDLLGFAVVSNSPELLVRVDADGRAITRPIKGTRPRTTAMDRALADSEKDAAELNMIVDLERNDLGRVCEIGSVHVTQRRTVEAHPTIYHGVATVEGQLRRDVDLLALLTAIFPGGSITGAPKIRAMQIIDELEPDTRGPYCGAVGHFDADGSLQLNVAIRTATLADDQLTIPVGGGIVADSEPVAEFDETLVKAAALLDAVEYAKRGSVQLVVAAPT